MSEKINFLSGEVLTATNLNKAFDEKLNANSIDENSSIDMENGIELKSTVGIDLNINDSTKILLNNNMCKIIGDPIELRADKINLYKKSGDKHSEIDLTNSTKVNFSKQVAAPSIYLNNNYINYSDKRRVYMPDLKKSDDTLVGESQITEIKNEDLKKYWYTLSVSSGTTLNSSIIDEQNEGITTLAKLVEKLDGILNDSYYSDRVYVNVTVNGTKQILKFCGKSTGTSISYYYFNNTEYKVKLSQNNNETIGSVIRSGFNKASVQTVYAGETKVTKSTTTDADSITCYLNDDGEVVKVLSFYMMRTATAKTSRITKLVLPISIDGFPLYEGSTPTIKSARGVCGVWDTNDTRIKILSLDKDNCKMSVTASSIEFTFDWDKYPRYSNYMDYPTMIYAEWI